MNKERIEQMNKKNNNKMTLREYAIAEYDIKEIRFISGLIEEFEDDNDKYNMLKGLFIHLLLKVINDDVMLRSYEERELVLEHIKTIINEYELLERNEK